EVALVAPSNGSRQAADLSELAGVVRSAHRPHLVLAGGPEGSERPELLRERAAVEGRPAAYVCENFACKAPVTEPDELAAALRPERRARRYLRAPRGRDPHRSRSSGSAPDPPSCSCTEAPAPSSPGTASVSWRSAGR